MNKSELFKKAWEISRYAANKFGGPVKSYFSEALKMAYSSTNKTNAVSVEHLASLGGSEWIKGDLHRVYFNTDAMCSLIGLSFTTYKTGNISSASLNGESISNSKASTLRGSLAGKFWFDVKTEEFHCSYLSDSIFQKLVDAVKA